ncbi:MAG TPA: GNAT family N-acetyltransferase [Noviherbaspirillum sp.]|nr:GNAT family N-acetyltransferase [Noviherbaspirillum sp.]
MSYRLTLGDWARQKSDARAVRYEVFVIEQNVPVALEWDDMDAACVHAVVCDDTGQAVATGRLLPDGHIGRMAVRKNVRGQGIGGLMLEALMNEARQRGDRCVLLNAQTQAEPFYQRFGFVRDGEEFMEAGIPHIGMRRDFAV